MYSMRGGQAQRGKERASQLVPTVRLARADVEDAVGRWRRGEVKRHGYRVFHVEEIALLLAVLVVRAMALEQAQRSAVAHLLEALVHHAAHVALVLFVRPKDVEILQRHQTVEPAVTPRVQVHGLLRFAVGVERAQMFDGARIAVVAARPGCHTSPPRMRTRIARPRPAPTPPGRAKIQNCCCANSRYRSRSSRSRRPGETRSRTCPASRWRAAREASRTVRSRQSASSANCAGDRNGLPVSAITTSVQPCWFSPQTMALPINPEPPVTSTRLRGQMLFPLLGGASALMARLV